MLHEIDENRLGPLEIVDHDDLGAFGRACLEEPPEGELRLRRRRTDDRVGFDANRDQDLDQRPVGDALAVRKAPPTKDVGRVAHALEEVSDETRLPDAGRPEKREEPARAVRHGVLVVAPETLALPVSPDKRRLEPPREGVGMVQTPRSRKASTSSDFPFSASGSTGSTFTASRTSSRVSAPISVSVAAAACSRRAATLTASPVTSVSPSPPTTTSPVLIPIRASRPCSAIAARISDAARTARRASSSCDTGIPKTAMTASPTNFSTVPP